MTGVGAAAAARRDAARWLAAVGPGIACGRDNLAAALGLDVRLADDADAVEDVTNGPVSSEQPFFLQPVAAGPTNVGDDGPRVVVLAWCARTVFVLPLAADVPPRRPTTSTESDNSANRLRMTLLCMRASQHWARPAGPGFMMRTRTYPLGPPFGKR